MGSPLHTCVYPYTSLYIHPFCSVYLFLRSVVYMYIRVCIYIYIYPVGSQCWIPRTSPRVVFFCLVPPPFSLHLLYTCRTLYTYDSLYAKFLPGEAPQYMTQNYNLSNDDLPELRSMHACRAVVPRVLLYIGWVSLVVSAACVVCTD